MNRIELYIDRDNRLTLDFYYELNDDYPMTVFKGEKCYGVISKLCEDKILQIRNNSKTEEVSLTFRNAVLNISEYEQVFRKRGTGPIKINLSKYYEEEKQKTFKPKKVKRHNKYIGKQIIAGALVLTVLGVVVGKEISDKFKKAEDLPQQTTIVYETELPAETIYGVGNYEDTTKDANTLKDVGSTDIKINDSGSNDIDVFVSFEDTSETAKAKKTRDYYGDIIEKYSKIYGLDPKIVIGIATQERGIHSEKKDPGGATGLMQIQNSVWVGEKLKAYNYETKSYETITVNEKDLSDVFYNIKVGCMYFQNCMDYMDNNIIAAIQCYNYGYGNMKKVLNEYSSQTGKTRKEILNDISDCGWLDCRYVVSTKIGDSGYVEHVLRWIGPNIEVDSLKIDGNLINLNISSENQTKVK